MHLPTFTDVFIEAVRTSPTLLPAAGVLGVVGCVLLLSHRVGSVLCRLGLHSAPSLPGRGRWQATMCRRCHTLPPRRGHGRAP